MTPLLLLTTLWACTVADDTGDDAGCDANSDLEAQTSQLINDHRASLGLVELELDPCVSELARQHSADMADGTVEFGHDGFEDRVALIFEQIPDAQAAGENVAMNLGYADPAGAAVQGWLDSDPHRENIELPDFDLTGMGIAVDGDGAYWFTQLFVDRPGQ